MLLPPSRCQRKACRGDAGWQIDSLAKYCQCQKDLPLTKSIDISQGCSVRGYARIFARYTMSGNGSSLRYQDQKLWIIEHVDRTFGGYSLGELCMQFPIALLMVYTLQGRIYHECGCPYFRAAVLIREATYKGNEAGVGLYPANRSRRYRAHTRLYHDGCST